MEIGKNLKIVVIGIILCLASSGLNIWMVVKENFNYESLIDDLLILGVIIWGIQFIAIGKKLCKAGYTQTGVVTAGGALILWAITLIIYELFGDEDLMAPDTLSFYVWNAILLLGPAIFYFSLKQNEDDDDDIFMGMASYGMGAVVLSTLLLIGCIILVFVTDSGIGISVKSYGDLTVVEKSYYSLLAEWIVENFKGVTIALISLEALGYLLCLCSLVGLNDFVRDLQDYEEQEKKEKLMNELLNNYEAQKKQEALK